MNKFKQTRTNFIRKIKVYTANILDGRDKFTYDELEKKILYLCRTFIKNPATNLYICPETNKRIIFDEIQGISIIINYNDVKVLDKFVQEYPLSQRGYNSLKTVFDSYVIKKRIEIEDKMYENMKKSINSLYNKQQLF